MKPAAEIPAARLQLLEQARALDEEGAPPQAPAAAPAGPAAPAEPAPAPAPTLEQELAGMFAMIGAGLGKLFPSTAAVLTEGKALELAGAIVPVIQKYALERYFAGFAWRVELNAALIVVPTVIAVRDAIQQDLAARRAPSAAPAGAAEPAPPPGAATPPPPIAGVLKPIDK